MAAITTAGSGNWTSTTPNAPWPGGTVPTSADTVTIAKNHTVTLNATTCVATSVTLALGTTGGDAGGVLTASPTASSKLTLQQGITAPGSATVAYSTYLNFDMRSANAGVVCELVLNNVNATGVGNGITTAGSWNMRGLVRARWSTINSALVANTTMSVVIADCTGWVVGDKLVFATTSAYNATPRTDEVTIATITPGAGTTATVTWTDGTGTGGAVAYAHASGCPVGNFTSNLVIRPGTNGNVAFFHANGGGTSSSVAQHFTDVESRFCKTSSTQGAAPCGINTSSGQLTSVSNNAFYGWDGGQAIYLRNVAKVVTRQNNIFYSAVANAGCLGGQDVSGLAEIGPDENYALFRCAVGINPLFASQHQVGHQISGATAVPAASSGTVLLTGRANTQINNCRIWSCNSGISNTSVSFANGCTFGSAVFAGCDNNSSTLSQFPGTLTLKDCVFPAGMGITGLSATLPNSRVIVVNKNADPSVQEIYGSHSLTVPIIQRDTSLASTGRSTSAMLMTLNAATAVAQSFGVLAKAGQTIDILCLVRKSGTPAYGASTLPSVTVSGLGITPVVATMSGGTAADTWETLSVSATNSGVTDGELTVTFTAQSATAGAKAWFSGVPVSPFVTRCRHYGYTFDETNPTRTVNPTVSAAEATAAAYTGMTVTWGTSASSVDLGGDQTFQKLYDYTQAQACLNVGSALPLFGAGVAGSPVLFAQGSITTIGYTLNGVGALVLGDNWLFASVPWSYQYYGGTFSQLTTVPSFGGGTLQIGDAGTYTFDMTADMILDMTPTSTGTYNFALCNITGEVDLSNASAHAINLQLPAGTSYTTANNTGGAITVTLPATYQSVTVSGLVVGSRVQIYDLTSNTELANGVAGSSTYTWTDSVAASASRAIRLRVAYVSGATAKQFIEANIGTCGTGTGDAAVGYLASQVDDAVYIANGIDGSMVTECSIVGTNLFVDVNAGSITIARIYAFMVYWLSTVGGIEDQTTEMVAKDTANYVVNTGFKIRNSTTGPTVPLLITGGNIDPATGVATDILDTSGGSIFVNSSIVVPYSSGAEATIAIVQAGLSAQGLTTTVANRIDVAISTRATPADVTTAQGVVTAAITSAQTAINAHTDTQTENLDAAVSTRATAGDIYAAV